MTLIAMGDAFGSCLPQLDRFAIRNVDKKEEAPESRHRATGVLAVLRR